MVYVSCNDSYANPYEIGKILLAAFVLRSGTIKGGFSDFENGVKTVEEFYDGGSVTEVSDYSALGIPDPVSHTRYFQHSVLRVDLDLTNEEQEALTKEGALLTPTPPGP